MQTGNARAITQNTMVDGQDAGLDLKTKLRTAAITTSNTYNTINLMMASPRLGQTKAFPAPGHHRLLPLPEPCFEMGTESSEAWMAQGIGPPSDQCMESSLLTVTCKKLR